MINGDDVTWENTKESFPNWAQIPDHPQKLFIIRNLGSGKTNSLFNIIRPQPGSKISLLKV